MMTVSVSSWIWSSACNNNMMEPIYLYTENFFTLPKFKALTKRLMGRGFGGPLAVERSLLRGLSKLGVPFLVNSRSEKIKIACVLSGVATLRWAILEKQKGNIQKIIAGPNISMPLEADGIIFNKNIDIFLVPSPWVADFCDSFRPGFKSKVKIWAAGLDTLPTVPGSRQGCVIFQKDTNGQVFLSVQGALKQKNINYKVVRYGSFKREDYLRLLSRSRFLVYLSSSESQGLVLHEAWMMDVPTLVFNGGHLKNGSYEFLGSSSAPYLTPETGMFFSSAEEFALRLDGFLSKLGQFQPRQYHLNNFTDEVCAKKFLEVVNELSD